jgi:hypothetical protein
LNFNELAFLTFGEISAKEVKKRLKEIIRRIREAAGVDPNLPLPPMPKNGKVERAGSGADDKSPSLPWVE